MAELGPGAKAPAFHLPGLACRSVAVPGAAPLTLLAFTKASCPTCRWMFPFVQALHERAKGLAVVGVASDPVGEARAFVEELRLTFPIGVESAPWPVSAAYGLTSVPTLFLIETGTVRLASVGFSRSDFLEIASAAAAASPFPAGAAVPAFRPG
ncbi:MAG: peroxiredoxin family protein [Candidatus Eiseniibacteriota bacterium]